LQSLKGVGRLVEVYALKDAHLTVPNPEDYTENKIKVHSDDEVPSIAIIPFENKGADEDVFYAYGISVDLISDVSSAGLIRVASKKQIEDAGELPQDELAKKLDVRYMANGELWRMGEMFQLSVELYDTKDKKVVWSDRWQEKWDNLPTIKGSLSDGLLKALDTKPKVEQKIETTNTEAYEFYLKGKHKYEKRENTDDTNIARGLLQKAIELDDNLLIAKLFFAFTYSDYNKSKDLYTKVLQQAQMLVDNKMIAKCYRHFSSLYHRHGDMI
jgi:TolB-like protein